MDAETHDFIGFRAFPRPPFSPSPGHPLSVRAGHPEHVATPLRIHIAAGDEQQVGQAISHTGSPAARPVRGLT